MEVISASFPLRAYCEKVSNPYSKCGESVVLDTIHVIIHVAILYSTVNKD